MIVVLEMSAYQDPWRLIWSALRRTTTFITSSLKSGPSTVPPGITATHMELPSVREQCSVFSTHWDGFSMSIVAVGNSLVIIFSFHLTINPSLYADLFELNLSSGSDWKPWSPSRNLFPSACGFPDSFSNEFTSWASTLFSVREFKFCVDWLEFSSLSASLLPSLWDQSVTAP